MNEWMSFVCFWWPNDKKSEYQIETNKVHEEPSISIFEKKKNKQNKDLGRLLSFREPILFLLFIVITSTTTEIWFPNISTLFVWIPIEFGTVSK